MSDLVSVRIEDAVPELRRKRLQDHAAHFHDRYGLIVATLCADLRNPPCFSTSYSGNTCASVCLTRPAASRAAWLVKKGHHRPG
jgi:hypothetical protein